jgi:hypothetical protein
MNKQAPTEKAAEQKPPVKWLVPLPQKEKGTFGRPSLCAACRGNEDIGIVLNYFLYEASVEAERWKIDTSKVPFITLERTLDEILEGIKPSRTSKKTLIGYHQKLRDWEFVIPHGYKHRYDVYFQNVADAMAAPPPAEKRKPRGRHVSKRQSSDVKTTIPTIHDVKTTISEDSSDEKWLKVQSEMVALQSQIVKLQSEMVALQSQIVKLQSSQSSEQPLEQAFMTLSDASRLIDCNRPIETKERVYGDVADANHRPLSSLPDDLDDEVFQTMLTDWLQQRDTPTSERLLPDHSPVVKELAWQLQAMKVTMHYLADEETVQSSPVVPLAALMTSPHATDRLIGQTSHDAAERSSALEEYQKQKRTTGPLPSIPVTPVSSEKALDTVLVEGNSPDPGGVDARPFPPPFGEVGGNLPPSAETALNGKSEQPLPQTPLSSAKPSVAQPERASVAITQPSLLPTEPAQQASTNKQDETSDPIATKQTGNGKAQETEDAAEPVVPPTSKRGSRKPRAEKPWKKDAALAARIEHVFDFFDQLATDTTGIEYHYSRPDTDRELIMAWLAKHPTEAILRKVYVKLWETPKDKRTGFHWQENMSIRAVLGQYDKLSLPLLAQQKKQEAKDQTPHVIDDEPEEVVVAVVRRNGRR